MIRTILSRKKVSKYERVNFLGVFLISGLICGVIICMAILNVLADEFENFRRYLDSIRKEVDVALDELSGADK